jgi:pimeloyl-ACP methyl ester carboxylesterase
VRQPEVARLLVLLVAALLVVPVAQAGHDLVVTAAFLVEFLSAGEHRALSALTPPPRRQPLRVARIAVDRWIGAPGGTPLVLVHGYTPAGKDDPRVQEAAALLARAGFDVAVPTIPGLTRGRLRPADVAPVVATLAARAVPTVVVAVSVGAGPALLAAADPSVRDRVDVLLSLGGYASAPELLRFFVTGEYAWQDIRGRVTHDPAVVEWFLRANADLLDTPAREALTDPDRAAAALAVPSPAVADLLAALSPERVAPRIAARLVLVHGVDDRGVPYTERRRGAWGVALRELGALLLVVHGLVAAADS